VLKTFAALVTYLRHRRGRGLLKTQAEVAYLQNLCKKSVKAFIVTRYWEQVKVETARKRVESYKRRVLKGLQTVSLRRAHFH
jgi:division protein CdvB (Snf7/Vps24/ESCRT-III family)